MPSELPDGAYIGLDEPTYFAQDRLGSTDICNLATQGPGWWWSSRHNPDYQPEAEDAKHRIFGKALHALVLEGDAAFDERFALIPSKAELGAEHGGPPSEGGNFCITVDDIKTGLELVGMNPPGGKNKAFYVSLAAARAPHLVVWDAYEEAWATANEGKLPVSTAEDRQLRIMQQAIHGHPEVGALFKSSHDNRPLAELSCLFTDERGLRRRVRYDLALPQTLIDLKAMSRAGGGRPLNFAAGDHIARWAYHCQAADHLAAWKWLLRLVAEGRVHGGTAADRAWLGRFPQEADREIEYCWLLFQRPDARAGWAPVVFPWIESWGSGLIMDGLRARHRALETYHRSVAQFGLDQPWTVVEPVHTTAEGHINRVYLPSYIAEPEYAGERDDL